LDTLSLRLIPGIGRIFGAAGKKITPEMAKEIAQQGMLKTAGAYSLQGVKTAGIEGSTEVAQQFLERLQAGLDISDPAARDEYFESFIGGAVLGGTLSVPGKFMERGGAKQMARVEEQRLQDEADAKAEEEKQAALDAKDMAKVVAQQQKTGDMFGDVAGKAGVLPETLTRTGERLRAADERLDDTDTSKVPEFALTGAPTTTVRERERAVQEAGVEMPTYADVARTRTQLAALADQTTKQLNAAIESGNTEAYRKIAPQLENIRLALDATDKQLKALPQPQKVDDRSSLEAELSKLQSQFKKYTGEAFDKDKLDKIAEKIDTVQEKLKNVTEPTQPSLFEGADRAEAQRAAEERVLGAQSKEVLDAEAMQEEIERSRGIAEQYMRLPTADELKAQMKELRDEKARLEKSGEPWYAKGRLAEVERLIQELQPKLATTVAAQAKGEAVRPVASLQQEQRAKLDELLTRLEQATEAPNDTNLTNLADKASQNYIMLALEELDAQRAKENTGRLSDQQVLGFVQEMRRAFAPVVSNKSTGMLMYPQEGKRVTGLSPLAKQLEDIKQQFAKGEEEFTLKTQYGQLRPETREERAEATKGTSKVEKTKDGYRVVEQAALTPREKEAGKKVDVSNIGNVEQGELFGEANQKAVKKANVEALEAEVADLEAKFKKANSGKNLKAAIQTRAELEVKKEELKDAKEGAPAELESLATTRTTPKRFMAFVSAQSFKLRQNIEKAQKALEASKPKATSAQEDNFAVQAKQAKTGPLIERLVSRLEDSFSETKNELKQRSNKLRELFSRPLEYQLLFDIAAAKSKIEKYEYTIFLKENVSKPYSKDAKFDREKFIPALRKSIESLKATIEQAENYLADIKNRDRQLFTLDVENKKRSVQMTRKALKDALAEDKITQAQATKFSVKVDAIEAKAAKEFQDRTNKKRADEEAAFKRLESLSTTKRVFDEVPSAAVKSENISKFGKQIREKEALLATLPENTRGYIDLAREIAQLKEKRQAEITPIRVPVTTTRIAPTPAEDKLKALKAKTVETAKERAEDKKRQQERLAAGLSQKPSEAKEKMALLQGKLNKVEKEIAKDAKNVDESKKALKAAKTEKGKKYWQAKLDTLNNAIVAKNLAKTQESVKKKIKDLQTKGVGAEATLKALGDAPPRTQRQAPIKTGTAKPTRAKKARVDFDEDAVAHGVRYDDYMYVKQGMEFGFKARDEAAKTGEGLSKQDADAVISKVKVPKGLKLVVVNKLQGNLRDAVIAQGRNPETVRGGVMPNGGVFIVAENHTDVKDLQRTLAHEITGHLGIENLLGEAGMNALIKKITSQYGSVFELADKLGVGQDALAAFNSAKRIGKTDQQALATAVREMIAHTEESRPDKNFLAKAGEFIKAMVGAVRAALRKIGIDLDISTSDIFKLLRDARKDFNEVTPGAYVNKDGDILFSSKPSTATGEFANVLRSAGRIVAQQKPWHDRLFGELTGLTFQTKYLDRFAPVQKVLEKTRNSLKATQLMYFLRMHDQRMAWTSEIASHGAAILRAAKDGKGLIIESKDAANLKQVAEALRSAKVGTPEDTNRMFTLYLLAKRAKRVGIDKLNFSGKVTESMLKDATRAVENSKETKAAFEKAAGIYNEYNKGLVNFAIQTGAISKEIGRLMLASEDYVPFYREKSDGTVVLEIGGAPPIKIGNVAEQPYLHELIGGDEAVLDFFTSSLQNTAMMTDMALRNLAARNVAFTLGEMGLLKVGENEKGIGIRSGDGPANKPGAHKTIRFKVDGQEKHVIVDTDAAGVDSELLVRGLEGVNTALPNAVKMMNIPANLLRKWVTRNPAYALRQVIRDPMNAVMVSGVDTIPVISSLREIAKVIPKILKGEEVQSELRSKGILGGQVLTGTAEDQKQILTQITSGKAGWDSIWARADQLAIQGDAATRVVMYNNFLKQGLSEMEATLATLEAMNFSKRGISPSLFALSTMVPFMNAQIQGLNVLYNAFTGKMPFSDKLRIKQKLFQRAAMMTGFTMLYAAMMQDDEAYQNANDEEKLNNWFVYVPGVSEPVRVPIPFELGLLFKALPEAIVNTAFGDAKARDTLSALGKLTWNAIPISGPQGVKPLLETAINYSFYTGREIESDRLQRFEPGERYNDRTTELVKAIGQATNISPVKIEYLIRGYMGSIPLAIGSLANPVLRSGEGGEKPEGRPSELPLFGSFFQPTDAQGLVNKAYKDVEEINRTKETWKKMEEEGRYKEADALLDAEADVIGLASLAGKFRKQIGELTKQEREIKADPSMSAKEKRDALDEIRQDKINLAKELSSERG
jgi:hypothetical protein